MKYFHEQLESRHQQLCKNTEKSKNGTYARRRYFFRDECITHYSPAAHGLGKAADPPHLQQWNEMSSISHDIRQAAAQEFLE